MKSGKTFDVAVVGAGVFGAWTALELRKAKLRVLLIDAHGAGNSRSSSGDESRIIRMSYGRAAVYTRVANYSMPKWLELSKQNSEPLFHRTGVLLTALPGTSHFEHSRANLKAEGIPFDFLENRALRTQYPQIAFPETSVGLLEPDSGALMARRAVRAVVAKAIKLGVEYRQESILAAHVGVDAGQYVFACGGWLPRLFPSLLKTSIHPTRQDVYYFGTPPGDRRFRSPEMPVWIDFGAEVYSLPDLEARGLKFAVDRHGAAFDPELGKRTIGAKAIAEMRKLLRNHFPGLADSPLLETRVCQYENSNNGDFIIDRHPEMPNVWIAGGGSGHGFKHGPAVGAYVSSMVQGSAEAEPLFQLKSQPPVWNRIIQ